MHIHINIYSYSFSGSSPLEYLYIIIPILLKNNLFIGSIFKFLNIESVCAR